MGAMRKATTTATSTATASGPPRKPGKRYVGVRQRPSGRWVAEIKDTIQKIRVWLGTYDSAEDAARAYDEAACLLRGAKTRTNFWPRSPFDHSAPPALPPKISSLLIRHKAKNSPSNKSTVIAPSITSTTTINFSADQCNHTDFQSIEEFKFADFLSDHNFSISSSIVSAATSYSSGGDSCLGEFMEAGCAEQERRSQRASSEEQQQDIETLEPVDFWFVANMEGLPGFYAPLEIAEDIGYGSMETVERMKYERRISASLYALNGVSECLKMKRRGLGDHLSDLSNACKKKKLMFEVEEEAEKLQVENQQSPTQSHSPPPPDESSDGDLLIWSSVDLPPICWLT